MFNILAEGAIALSVTLSGGALFASGKLLQFPSSLIVKVILAIFMRASAQHTDFRSLKETLAFAVACMSRVVALVTQSKHTAFVEGIY